MLYHLRNTLSRTADGHFERGHLFQTFQTRFSDFNIRLNNYRSRINNPNTNNLLPVEAHFKQKDHSFQLHAKFTVIEKIELMSQSYQLDNILKNHEDDWMVRLKTITPYGLNVRLNQPRDEHLR